MKNKKKQFSIKNKRGELTTKQIVTMIVLIVSFVIVLFLLFRLNLGGITDREICHNSVVTRGSSVLPTDSVPLKCQRSYLCLTNDGSCEALTKPMIEKVKTEEEVYGVLAEELATCWWMFGEGKINYVGTDLTEKLYCSICAQVAFDDSVNEVLTDGMLDKEELYVYMQDNKVIGKDETYLNYLYGTNDLNGLKERFSSQGVEFGSLDLNKQYYVMMGITSEISKLSWAAIGVVTVAAIAFTPVVGGAWGIGFGVVAIAGAGGGTGGYFAGILVEGLSGNEYLSPSIIEVNSEEFRALGCKSITTLS
ncbi:MAG TPA: hypothetical protein ENI22_00945 [Candidatus Pacearchaeota archaeon]|nr:hypothetical protein [Candidatus Pacearchaeota archaeon]